MLDFIVEKILFPFAILFIVASLLLVGLSIWTSIQTARHCGRWEDKTSWQEPWTQFVWAGKVMVPIYHPGQFVTNSECVQPI
jgi:hypothetical protein